MASDPNGWYKPTLDSIEPETRELFEQYSKIPSDQVIPHIEAVRNKAWKTYPYPCLGRFHFLTPSLTQHPLYRTILTRLSPPNTDLFLDLGCCLGQDIRRLIHDGANPSNLHGSDLLDDFLQSGYDLFRDRDSLPAETFFAADALEEDSVLQQRFGGRVDVLHAASFFHLFPLETQKVAARRVVSLLSRKPGSVMVGRQGGDKKGKEIVHVADNDEEGDGEGMENKPMRKLFWHNETTWAEMWREVAELEGRELNVWSELVADDKVFTSSGKDNEGKVDSRKHGSDTMKMIFVIKSV